MKRLPTTTLPAATAALIAVVGAAVTGCGYASSNGATPAGSSGRAAGSSASGAVRSGHASAPTSPGSGTGGPGTAPGSPAGVPPSAVRVCSDAGGVRTVRVTRIPGLGQPEPGRPLPSRAPAITISSRRTAVALAEAICALPPMPRGMLSCPVDLGGGFGLVFSTADVRLWPVIIRASGCEMVLGASRGRPKWIPASPRFWVTFARLTGIKNPVHHP